MNTVHIPASITEATDHLNGIESLMTAKGWERSAVVAAFVRLHDGPGQPSIRTSTNTLSTVQFAALGIAGLQSDRTVRIYVKAWLDSHDGIYPEPGADVIVPTEKWPPTRPDSAGSRIPTETAAAIIKIVERDGSDAVADAIAEAAPRVATEVHDIVEHATARAAREQTDPADEVARAGERSRHTAEMEEREAARGRADHTMSTMKASALLLKARRIIGEVGEVMTGVEFTDEEQLILEDDRRKVQTALDALALTIMEATS